MLIFQFREHANDIEAIVLAADEEAATAIFQMHVRGHDGDPDTLLWRALSMDNLQDAAAAAVREALEMDRAGLVICDAAEQWAFVVPLGDHGHIGEG